LVLEIFELTKKFDTGVNRKEVENLLRIRSSTNEEHKRLIENGLEMI